MPRPVIYGFIACCLSVLGAAFFIYNVFFSFEYQPGNYLTSTDSYTYYSIAAPIGIIALSFLGTGLWVGFTILSIKVVPPMPELAEKRNFPRVKAFFLCVITLALGILLIYGIYRRSYWALAIPAAAATLLLLGMIFWVGIAIITARSTLPKDKE
ncbi:MAG: hypothetical protein JW864_08230 [Spirochaetes bacterium]|nr:hypothetical protein [Spirochaetota bacterium]